MIGAVIGPDILYFQGLVTRVIKACNINVIGIVVDENSVFLYLCIFSAPVR